MNKVALIILDGFGEGKDYPGNAITRAKTPFLDTIRKNYPKALLKCKGLAVGLPKGNMGGSEVGHYTIGAGRVVLQSLEEINQAIKDKSFFKKKPLLRAMTNCKKKKSNLHLVGMISDAGVHSHLDHLLALIKMAKSQFGKTSERTEAEGHPLGRGARSEVNNLALPVVSRSEHINKHKVFIHAITDGRDVREKSAMKFIQKIQKAGGEIVTICGRYYSMDRDKNLNRTKKAFNLMTKGKGFKEKTPASAIKNAYKRGDETDYYLQPMILNEEGIVKDGDSVVFFNFRTDRARQLTQMFLQKKPKVHFVCMGQYSDKAPIVFPESKIKNNLGQVLAKHKKKQIRIAETEKYAHVTFFFNSQEHKPNKGEDRVMVPSPKVPSYDMKPEMNAAGITREGLKAIKKSKYDFMLINYANTDLVGHSGTFKAVKKAVEIIDQNLEKLIPAAEKAGYHIILTSDHGNAEEMKYPDGSDKPAHTLNRVPCWIISDQYKAKKRSGELCNITATVLKMMNLKQPGEMTCKSLV